MRLPLDPVEEMGVFCVAFAERTLGSGFLIPLRRASYFVLAC